jgi:SAM-dependent methyltransferase
MAIDRDYYEHSYHFDQDIESPAPKRLWRALRLLQPLAGTRFLDLGSGVGWAARLAADFAYRPLRLGADAIPKVLRVQGDGTRLPFPDDSFDRVLSFGSIEHFPDVGKGLEELARVLAPGGRGGAQLPREDRTATRVAAELLRLATSVPADRPADPQDPRRLGSRGVPRPRGEAGGAASRRQGGRGSDRATPVAMGPRRPRGGAAAGRAHDEHAVVARAPRGHGFAPSDTRRAAAVLLRSARQVPARQRLAAARADGAGPRAPHACSAPAGIIDAVHDGGNGELVDTGDAAGFARAVLRALARSYAERAAIRDYTLDHFSWRAMAEAYDRAILEELGNVRPMG